MIPDATFDPTTARSALRLRFSLLALLIFVTLVGLLLAWWVQPNRVVATALFRVSAVAPSILNDQTGRASDEQGFEIVRRTQIAVLKAYFVLNSALRKPGIASLPTLQSKPDPVEWLQENLEVDFPDNAEILAIRLRGTEGQANDLVQIVDAVVKAYQDQVLYAEQQRRLAGRDLLARSLENLQDEVTRKWEGLVDIVRETGQPGVIGNNDQQELDIRLLDNVEIRRLRLDEEQLKAKQSGDAALLKTLEEQITHARLNQSMLKKRITAREEIPVELLMRRQELERLQRIANEIAIKLERMDIEAQAPSRIEQIQPAVISSDD